LLFSLTNAAYLLVLEIDAAEEIASYSK
jgi:hypothetical protein